MITSSRSIRGTTLHHKTDIVCFVKRNNEIYNRTRTFDALPVSSVIATAAMFDATAEPDPADEPPVSRSVPPLFIYGSK